MATYKFDWLNGGSEIVDPTITINSDNITIFPSNMTIDVDVILETPNGSKFGVRLFQVPVVNMNYDSETLGTRVMAKLAEYEI